MTTPLQGQPLSALTEAESPFVPAWRLAELSRSPMLMVRYRVAQHPRTTPDVLERLARDRSLFVCEMVARNPNCQAVALERLATHKNASERAFVGAHRQAPASVLALLGADPVEQVREAVAGNPATASGLLEALIHEVDVGIRVAAAGNTSASAVVLAAAGQDPTPVVQEALICNPSATVELFAELFKRASPALSLLAETTLDTSNLWMSVLAACSRNTSILEFRALSHSLSRGVRWRVACNPATPTGVLTELARDEDDRVRAAATARLAPPPPEMAPGPSTWERVVAPYGLAVEKVAWQLMCEGVGGTVEELVAIAVGSLAS